MIYQQAYQVRGFKPEDLQYIIEINRLCLPENYTPSFFMEIYQNCPQAFLVAETNCKIVGYSMCRLEYGFSDFNRIRMVKKGHLVSIAVLEPFRRQRIADNLLDQSLRELYNRGAKECFLEVRNTNLAGIELYKKHGFQIIRSLSYYYHDGADALLMSKRLGF